MLQPYVTGEPLSASFLVDVNGRPHLIGVGRQRMEIRHGRFVYLGGTVPADDPELAEEARQAILSVPGLRGWVGVDFVHKMETGHSVILEINPRATTSYVGLRRLLPPGTLASAWLAAFDRPEDLAALDLASQVHAQPPRHFAADGTLDNGENTRDHGGDDMARARHWRG